MTDITGVTQFMHQPYQSDSNNITRIVILGGGTAGWISAGVIAATQRARGKHNKVHVTLVESPTIPIAGVGEGTWPSMRRTLKLMGIRETDFITRCNATFKQGAKFRHWVTGQQEDEYYHPLVLPTQFGDRSLAEDFVNQTTQEAFDKLVCAQGHICDLGLAPKNVSHREYEGLLNYAYHLDACAFAAFLKEHCTNVLGINYLSADIDRVEGDRDGPISALITRDGQRIHGDFFVDCSGFSARLIGQHYGIEYVSCADTLFCNKAATVQLGYYDDTILPYTLSTATEAGWIWDIGLPNRRGVGHVYANDYITDDMAKKQLERYAGRALADDEVRLFDIAPGNRKTFWKANCVAIGLSAGFLEPLEASSLVLVEMAAKFVAENLPKTAAVSPIIAKRFNETFSYRWQRIIDFLKLHYVLSKRSEPFWQKHRDNTTWPDSLQEQLALWHFHPPAQCDFPYAEEVFPCASYQYVLYGMQPNYTQKDPDADKLSHMQTARCKAHTYQQVQLLKQQLYSQRTLIDNIIQYGLPQR
ncbi:tryptophan halogenase family protein [Aestuariibacter sp. A3R04]|uniref:tryptophan halogenase family protein n=1 Tax=Aestuariibacter sp. A3R04 TaxID=2841571 RepID=UPI002090F65F|nr:tryptophan halogenase family protein [Aestuariibacter sp. A3R04]